MQYFEQHVLYMGESQFQCLGPATWQALDCTMEEEVKGTWIRSVSLRRRDGDGAIWFYKAANVGTPALVLYVHVVECHLEDSSSKSLDSVAVVDNAPGSPHRRELQ